MAIGILCLGVEFTVQSSPCVFFPAFRLPTPPLRVYLSIPNTQAARPQRGLPSRRLKYCKLLSKLFNSSDLVGSQLSNVFTLSLFRSLSNQNFSDTSDEREMILKQNLDVLVPKYIGTISFALHFLEQIQRAD